MRVQFATWGNSLALRIPQAFAKELSAKSGTPAEVTVLHGKLVVEPIAETPVYDLEDLLAGMTQENIHEETNTGYSLGNEF